MFAKTMNLQKPQSCKINRDFISVLTNYIAPSSLAKTSTTEQMASHFHHSRVIHNNFYAAETFKRDKDGNMIPGPLSVAHQIWCAMGENMLGTNVVNMRPTNTQIILTKHHYDFAAKRAYQDPSAKVTELQYEAINHASSRDINKHAFIFMGCGTGKSGVYNLLLLGAYLHMSPIPKTMVISPHNSLLAMHKLQARHYLRGTNLTVVSLLPDEVQNQNFPQHFDLLFISIHAFNVLMVEYSHVIAQWNLQNIFIDEYHNIIGELFRYSTSWQSLRLIASLNVKIMLLSATTEKQLMRCIAKFMKLGDFDVIGSTTTYPIPNVGIHIISNELTNQHNSLLQVVVAHCQKLTELKKNSKFKIHAMTMSRVDAKELSDRINSVGIKSMWLTSGLPPEQRTQFLQLWEEGNEQVLVSTFTDGIDNSATEDIIIVGATHSIYSLIQAIGRIRPKRQRFNKSSVYIFHSKSYFKSDVQALDDSLSTAIGANIFLESERDLSKEYYRKMFHSSGYQKWIQQKLCYRKVLYEHFSISSQSCNHCSNCRQQNVITKSAIISNKAINKEDSQRKLVCDAIHTMLTCCFICHRRECNGIQCFPQGRNRCFCCHVIIYRENFHKSSLCPADTSGNKIDTRGQSCPCCFLSFSNDIPDRGKTQDHMNNKCPHQKRVKRVLLYGVENAKDPGVTARNLLVSALSNPTHWFSIMANNINVINKRKK